MAGDGRTARRATVVAVGLVGVLAACSSASSGRPSAAQRRSAAAAARAANPSASGGSGLGEENPNLQPGAPGAPDLVETTLPNGRVTSVARSSSSVPVPAPSPRSLARPARTAIERAPRPPAGTLASSRPRATTRPAPAPNHAPVLTVSGRSYDERRTADIAVSVSDPDGNRTTLTTSSLPGWLSLSSRHLRGLIPITASSATVDWRRGLRYSNFPIRITATDSRGASTSRTITLRVRDEYRRMPDYIGKLGNGTDGPPSIYAISRVSRSCAYQRRGNGTRIYWQSVRPRAVIPWGARITYLYGRNRTSCRHVSGHYPG